MTALSEFMLARITEDEAVALSARGPGDGEWASWNRSWDTSPMRDLAADGVRVATLPITIDEHICRHDPARVLAECEAKRQILALSEHGCGDDYQRVQHALALPYAEHPDFRREWKS